MHFGAIIRNGRIVDQDSLEYDLVVRNATIVDPARGIEGPGTVYTRDGRFVEPAPGREDAPAGLVVDASGCLVFPGLIDSHGHFFAGDGESGTDADLLCLPNGVVAAVDCGSAGSEHFAIFHRADIVPSRAEILSLLNVCPGGMVHAPYGENVDPAYFDMKETLRLFRKYPRTIRGLKLRMGGGRTDALGLEALRHAVAAAENINREGLPCLVEVHALHMPEALLPGMFDLLRPGDIFVHTYHACGKGILDADGAVEEHVRRARERGVLFDACGGRILFSIETIGKCFDQGFFPDLAGTDMVSTSAYRKPPVCLPVSMTLLHRLGMPLAEIVRAVTASPARAFGVADRYGSMAPGLPANLAVFKLADAKVRLFDGLGAVVEAERVFMPMLTVKDGVIRHRQTTFLDEL